jgi:hypothetical protein
VLGEIQDLQFSLLRHASAECNATIFGCAKVPKLATAWAMKPGRLIRRITVSSDTAIPEIESIYRPYQVLLLNFALEHEFRP